MIGIGIGMLIVSIFLLSLPILGSGNTYYDYERNKNT